MLYIFSCVWDNELCSADDFAEVLTDHGVCFTFNSGNNGKVLEVMQTGIKGHNGLHVPLLALCKLNLWAYYISGSKVKCQGHRGEKYKEFIFQPSVRISGSILMSQGSRSKS